MYVWLLTLHVSLHLKKHLAVVLEISCYMFLSKETNSVMLLMDNRRAVFLFPASKCMPAEFTYEACSITVKESCSRMKTLMKASLA